MRNDVLEEYLARVRAALAALPDEERDAVVAETRAHVEEAVEARMAAEPGASRANVTLEETRAFGDPAEIAAARGAAPPPRERPDRVHGWPRWAWVLGGALLLAAAAVAIAELTEDKASSFTPYHRANGLANHTGEVNETFTVPPNAKRFTLTVHVEQEKGCAGVRVTDPLGAVVLDEWDACGDMLHALDFRPLVSGQTGEWRVEVRYRDFTGESMITSGATLD